MFFVVMVVREAISSAATYTWKTAPCQILESDVRESSERSPWFAYLRYTSPAGESVRSSRLFQTYYEAVHFTRRWPAGSSTTCYLDPRDPAGALLERKGVGFVLLLFLPIPLLFVLIGAIGFYNVVFRVKPHPVVRHAANPVAGRRFVAGSLMVVGSVLFLAFLLGPVRHALAARSWRGVDCKILRSDVRRFRGRRGSDGFAPQIFYSYLVDGQEHRSDIHSFFELSSNGWAAARRIASTYRPGSSVICYVNPADPDDATLHRKPSPAWLIGLVPLALIIGGLKVWPAKTAIE